MHINTLNHSSDELAEARRRKLLDWADKRARLEQEIAALKTVIDSSATDVVSQLTSENRDFVQANKVLQTRLDHKETALKSLKGDFNAHILRSKNELDRLQGDVNDARSKLPAGHSSPGAVPTA